jgi:hypothetical protein
MSNPMPTPMRTPATKAATPLPVAARMNTLTTTSRVGDAA